MRKNLKLIMATVALAGLPFGTQAAIVTYDFTVTATEGSLAGTTASGLLSFDDSLLAVPNTSNQQTGLLTDLSFTWNGTTFDASTANTGFINSGVAGQLARMSFGDNCYAGGCSVSRSDPNDWYIDYNPLGTSTSFVYSDGTSVSSSSEVTFSLVPTPVPLPAAGWLLLSALGVSTGLLRYTKRVPLAR